MKVAFGAYEFLREGGEDREIPPLHINSVFRLESEGGFWFYPSQVYRTGTLCVWQSRRIYIIIILPQKRKEFDRLMGKEMFIFSPTPFPLGGRGYEAHWLCVCGTCVCWLIMLRVHLPGMEGSDADKMHACIGKQVSG